MNAKTHLNIGILLTGLFLVNLAWAEDYILTGKSEELKPWQTFDNVTLSNGATLTTYGVLRVNGKFTMEGNSKLLVKPFDKTINGTGTLTIYASDITITEGSIISADAAGNDGRGFRRGAGGGYGGQGGQENRRGEGGATYGVPGGDGVFMGSASDTVMGGGAIFLISQWLYVDGSSKIMAKGGDAKINDEAGASGGGILINSDGVYIFGSLDASGGAGIGHYGDGGAGGRIKIHYFIKQIGSENQAGIDAAEDLGEITVKGKPSGAYSGDGQDGTIWFNHAPNPPSLIAPTDATTVSPRPVFQFSAVDDSDKVDGRNQPDKMRFRIELSQDNFQTILYSIDQSARYVRGWIDDTGVLRLWHDSGAEATYLMQENLQAGTYQWRVYADDGKESDLSEIRTFTVTSTPSVEITQVTPDIGTAGQPVSLTGNGFVEGATVTFGGIPVANVHVVSDTQIMLDVPTGNTDWVDIQIQNPDGGSARFTKAFRYVDLNSYTARMSLNPGLHMISLPLNPDQPHTASSLATELDSTIVIHMENGRYNAYVHDGERGIGTDFPIEMGRGYVINLRTAKLFEVTGTPWGEPGAPTVSQENQSEAWAFVVTGRLSEIPSIDATMQVINPRTGQELNLPLHSNGEFIGAFVDLTKHAVISPGDTLILKLFNVHGTLSREPQHLRITSTHIAQAYLHATLATSPQTTRLLQNYPNPFNPETWIPFQLAKDAHMAFEIYNLSGHLVRRIDLGHRPAGWFVSRERAAYWDGHNAVGERISSGVYWVVMKTETFSATRRIVVLK